jgi:hypothetical protein
MATEKDLNFLHFIVASTDSGKIKWEPAAEPDRFVTSFRGKYNVIVDKTEQEDGGTLFYLKLTDDADQELLTISHYESSDVKQLFYLARRRSLNVDAAIDEIMGAEPGPGPIKDEDIPF